MLFLSHFYESIFSCKTYKLSLDAGCTCPNRDGTLGFGGCIFCSESGSGDFASSRNLSIKEQVEQAETKEEAKDLIAQAGMELTDDELNTVAGGRGFPYGGLGPAGSRSDRHPHHN